MSPRHIPATQAELARIGLLAELPGERLAGLAQRMRREEVRIGETPAVDGDRFYVVLNGVLAVKQPSDAGTRRMLRPGDYFGEVSPPQLAPTESVHAVTPATVASCDRETYEEYVRPLLADTS